MFNRALSAVAPHCPLSSTPLLSSISPLSSAVVVVHHRYCPHRPPSTTVRRRQRHRRPSLLTPLSTTVINSTHRPHCPSSAVLVYVCSLPSPSTVLRLSHPSTSSSADGNDDDPSFGCHRQRWMAAMAVATLAVSCGSDGMEATPPLLVVHLHHRPPPVLCGKQRSYPTVIAPPPLPVKGTQPIAPTLRPDWRGGGVGLARRVVTIA